MAKAQTTEQRIAKKFGDNILVGAQSVLDSKKIIIPISPKFNMITGGGILEGSTVTISGSPKLGKTTLCLYIASIAQKVEYGGQFCPDGRDVYYYNVEARLRQRDIEGIPGLNIDKLHIIESVPGKILNGAEYLEIADTLINEKLGSVHIIDSFSALCTEKEMTGGMDEMQRADGPKLLAKFCRKISNVVPVNKNIVIGIVHIGANPSGYGAAIQEKGGYAIKYQVDTKLRGKTFRPWKLSVDGGQVGQDVDWVCDCSPLGPPGQSTTSYIRYGMGIDKYQELITLCVDVGIVKQGGAWYTFVDKSGEEHKFQGTEKFNQAIKSDESLYGEMEEALYEMVGVK